MMSIQVPPGYYGPRCEMLAFIPRTCTSVLDVGCGVGDFGKKVKELIGTRVWGVEVLEDAAREAARKLDRVLLGSFQEAQALLAEERFDCITFLDSLEHMVDPWAALKAAAGLLSEKGSIVASIPNVRYWPNLKHLLFARDWQYVDIGILDRTHLRFFTERSMRRMLEDVGLEVGLLQGINQLTPGKLRKKSVLYLAGLLLGRDIEFCQFAVVSSRPASGSSSVMARDPVAGVVRDGRLLSGAAARTARGSGSA